MPNSLSFVPDGDPSFARRREYQICGVFTLGGG